MSQENTEPTIDPELSTGGDAASVGWALSLVTCVVLVVGVLVVRSTRSETPPLVDKNLVPPAIVTRPAKPRLSPIVVRGTRTAPNEASSPEVPRKLPPSDGQALRSSTAGRYTAPSADRR